MTDSLRHDIADPRTYTSLYWHDRVGVDQVGKQVSVYVRAADLPLWERAERYARKHRMPVSGLIMAALEAYLSEQRDEETKR